jgi:hypothetical protein
MRKLFMFAALLASATAVQAQEAPREAQAPVPVEATVETEATAVPSTDAQAPVETVDLNPRSTTAASIEAATVRAPVDVEESAQDVTTPRNFWWLVAAIVLAGVLLAVLL